MSKNDSFLYRRRREGRESEDDQNGGGKGETPEANENEEANLSTAGGSVSNHTTPEKRAPAQSSVEQPPLSKLEVIPSPDIRQGEMRGLSQTLPIDGMVRRPDAHDDQTRGPAPIEMMTEESIEQILDLRKDPLVEPGEGPSSEWLEQVAQIQPRKLVAPTAQTQAELVNQILKEIEAEAEEPEPDLVNQTEQALDNLQGHIPNAKRFVAGSFQAFLPAWKALLSKSKRASSRQALTWLQYGFVPKFVGTADAPERQKEEVRGMLKKVGMTGERVEEFLRGQRPRPVELRNHQSFYVHVTVGRDIAARRLTMCGNHGLALQLT
jgi:hypothetical protein